MNIKTYLKENNLTQKKFADALGLTSGAIGQWIRGESEISATQAVRIERMTNKVITVDEMINLKPTKKIA